jgi:hypothetical protein
MAVLLDEQGPASTNPTSPRPSRERPRRAQSQHHQETDRDQHHQETDREQPVARPGGGPETDKQRDIEQLIRADPG